MPTSPEYCLPAEWEPQQRTWIAWPRPQTWGDGWQAAEQAFARVANCISEHQAVTMLCDAALQPNAQRLLSRQVECWPFDYDDAWLRDTGPVFIRQADGQLFITGWNFNGWGNKFNPWQQDRSLASRLAKIMGMKFLSANIIAEGGALHSDGQGALLTTEQCLLNENRNPGADQTDIELELERLTGAQQVIWLADGLEDDHTDGHIDELACFSKPGTILLCGCEDADDPNHAVINAARQKLTATRDAAGNVLEIIEVPQPEQRRAIGGNRLTLSYINFYLCNGALIMPEFEQQRHDANARAILAEQFSDRIIYQLPALPIVAGGGGIHCITQQQPIEVMAG